jgi:hypothetical protein
MEFDIHAVARNIRRATTLDLLDRVTVYRNGMEPAAVDLMENELARRGVSPEEIDEHDQKRRETALFYDDGTARRCTFCDLPAVVKVHGWHRLGHRPHEASGATATVLSPLLFVFRRTIGWLPLFPRTFYYCPEHRPADRQTAEPDDRELAGLE